MVLLGSDQGLHGMKLEGRPDYRGEHFHYGVSPEVRLVRMV